MFRSLFKILYFTMWRNTEKTDIKRYFIIPSNIDVSSFYMNDDKDYYNLIKVYKKKNEKDTSKPLIINIHGGGWALKNWVGYEPYYAYFASRGYDTIGFSYYSMREKYSYADTIKHIFNVLHYIYDNHRKLNVSLDNVFLSGDSAGGQLSLFIYSINKSKELQKIFGVTPVNIDIKALVLIHPVCFLDNIFASDDNGFIHSKFINQSFLECLFSKKYLANPHYLWINPYKYLSIVKEYPPILLIASNGDARYKDNEIRLHNTLNELGIKHDYFFEEDPSSRHVYNIAYLGMPIANKCNDYIDSFIQNIIKKRKSSISED